VQVVFAHLNAIAMGVKTFRPNKIYNDNTMRTFVFTSQRVQMSPPKQIFSRRVLDTFDRSKVSGEHEKLMT